MLKIYYRAAKVLGTVESNARDFKRESNVSTLFTAPRTDEDGAEAEERQEKPSSGRESSTGDTSSGSDSSSDSSTSSISDAENGSNDMNDENPFQTPATETLPEEPKNILNVGRSPIEETGLSMFWRYPCLNCLLEGTVLIINAADSIASYPYHAKRVPL